MSAHWRLTGSLICDESLHTTWYEICYKANTQLGINIDFKLHSIWSGVPILVRTPISKITGFNNIWNWWLTSPLLNLFSGLVLIRFGAAPISEHIGSTTSPAKATQNKTEVGSCWFWEDEVKGGQKMFFAVLASFEVTWLVKDGSLSTAGQSGQSNIICRIPLSI